LAAILIVVMGSEMALGLIAGSIYRNTTERGYTARKEIDSKLRDVAVLRNTYESQVQQWKNVLIRGHDEEAYYRHLSQFYEAERMAFVVARDLARKLTHLPVVQQLIGNFRRNHRHLGRKYRDALRIYNASDVDAQTFADSHVGELEDEIRTFLIRIEHAFREVRQNADSDFDALLAFQQRASVIGALALTLCSILIVFWFLNVRMVRPLRHAIWVAEQIAGGDLKCKILVKREDEIGKLLMALNAMQESLVRSQTKAGQFTARLEQTVAERTKELTWEINERRQAQEALTIAKEQAEEANCAKSHFLASMSHDLRTPLNAIIGFADVIAQQRFGPTDEKYREYAKDIQSSGEHLLALVNEILDLSTIEAGEKSLNKETVALHEIVAECTRIIKDTASAKDIDLRIRAPENLPLVHADKRAIKQVLLNLLSNAVNFTPNGGEVHVVAVAVGEYIKIAVIDTGPGISNEDLPHIMTPFRRGENDPYRANEGWGLGLAIAKSLIDLHDGEITLESELGKGTTVTVALPTRAAMVDDKALSLGGRPR